MNTGKLATGERAYSPKTEGVSARLRLFPITTELRPSGDGKAHLYVNDADLAELAERYGTPLYVYDQATMDAAVEAYRAALTRFYPGPAGVTYAGKAFLIPAAARWAQAQGLWIDCTGVGEMHVARAAQVPRDQVLVHGVNKTPEDLSLALEVAGVIVVDNLSELRRIRDLAGDRGRCPDLWLRVRPGLAVDTHAYRQTGQEESKFGMSWAECAEAVTFCQAHGLPVTGVHFHQGSHFHDPAPLGPAIDHTLDLLARLRDEQGWIASFLSPGGGWGVPYHEEDLPHPPIADYVAFVAARVQAGCEARGLPLPHLQLEPGRSLVAQAGVALYRVGVVKHSAARRWILLDGGMADNIRPSLYGARYSALPVVEPLRPPVGLAWLAGPYCESGDVLIEDLPMPAVEEGELIAIPVSGAYHLMMASNYNGARRPAVLWLHEGEVKVVQRRETTDDLLRRDLFHAPNP